MPAGVSPPRLEELVSPGQRFLFGIGVLLTQFAIAGLVDWGGLPRLVQLTAGPLVAFAPPLLLARSLGISVRESFAIHLPRASQAGWSVLAGVALVPPMVMLGALNAQWIEPAPWFVEAMEELEPGTLGDWATIVLVTVLLVPLAEELVFRGILQPASEPSFGPARAAVIVGLIFAAMHFEPWYLLPLAVIGMVLGLARWITGSIIPCAIIHGAYNLGMMVLGRIAKSGEDADEAGAMGAGLLLIAAIAGVWLAWAALGRLRPVRPEPGSHPART